LFQAFVGFFQDPALVTGGECAALSLGDNFRVWSLNHHSPIVTDTIYLSLCHVTLCLHFLTVSTDFRKKSTLTMK
jgi:hypothetical protein